MQRCSSRPSRRPRRSTLPAGTKLAYVTQTTLSVDETGEIITTLRRRFPEIRAPRKEDICYATSNRQWAVKEMLPRDRGAARDRLAQLVELEPARRDGARRRYRRVPDRRRAEIDETWLEGAQTVGITSGASAPEKLVDASLRLVPRTRRDGHRAVPAGRGGRDVPPPDRAPPRARARAESGSGRNCGVSVVLRSRRTTVLKGGNRHGVRRAEGATERRLGQRPVPAHHRDDHRHPRTDRRAPGPRAGQALARPCHRHRRRCRASRRRGRERDAGSIWRRPSSRPRRHGRTSAVWRSSTSWATASDSSSRTAASTSSRRHAA